MAKAKQTTVTAKLPNCFRQQIPSRLSTAIFVVPVNVLQQSMFTATRSRNRTVSHEQQEEPQPRNPYDFTSIPETSRFVGTPSSDVFTAHVEWSKSCFHSVAGLEKLPEQAKNLCSESSKFTSFLILPSWRLFQLIDRFQFRRVQFQPQASIQKRNWRPSQVRRKSWCGSQDRCVSISGIENLGKVD